MRLLFFLILTTGFIELVAQVPQKYPFQDGEEVKYSVYYNLAWVWVDAAEVSFSVSDTIYQNKKALFFSSVGRSRPSYDWVFKVRDYFSSFVEPEDISPVKYHRKTQEGSHKVDNYYWFDKKRERIYSLINNSSNEGVKRDTLEYSPPIFDVLSATYFLRTIDFKNQNSGDTISVKTIMDNELIKINVIYLGKELVEHKNGKKYPSYKFKTKGVEGSIFDEDSELIVWVSKDENRIPLKIETKILVGSIKAYIFSVKAPKQKSSLINDFVVND